MMEADNLLFFVCTVATIMATLGALIGSFAVFRLQNIDAEIDLLKGIILDRPFGNDGFTLRRYLDFDRYHFIREIYDLNIESVNTLRAQASDAGAIGFNSAFEEDLKNIEHNTIQALKVRRANQINFIYSAVVILITQIIAIEAHSILKNDLAGALSFFVLGLLALGLWLFEKQFRNLIQ